MRRPTWASQTCWAAGTSLPATHPTHNSPSFQTRGGRRKENSKPLACTKIAPTASRPRAALRAAALAPRTLCSRCAMPPKMVNFPGAGSVRRASDRAQERRCASSGRFHPPIARFAPAPLHQPSRAGGVEQRMHLSGEPLLVAAVFGKATSSRPKPSLTPCARRWDPVAWTRWCARCISHGS